MTFNSTPCANTRELTRQNNHKKIDTIKHLITPCTQEQRKPTSTVGLNDIVMTHTTAS